ncbi:hypothetical protein FF011L_28160 [Roseimaritima multifibrata]|uniref:VWFA domain-containing protein n=1 Tax=Roseimaritima multifibrata TaxID=1930274 RepID=A0A517MGN9_9BACT|nr:BatA domain-containing protein [Roseimaritima multifibrata]QDS94039.1 hypothetical protein FF011L_28160 [Roseimaritima multifibrata]
MSLLTPLYLLAGLAVGLPILFHLIRQKPKEVQSFSSLMFLRTDLPRLSRRSRIENWLLLLMRMLAILLIASAFARPFLRSSAATSWQPPGVQRWILVDTSASMHQTGVWEKAVEQVRSAVIDLRPGDQVGLMTFDQTPITVVELVASNLQEEKSQPEAILNAIESLEPTWLAGNLSLALETAADHLNALKQTDESSVRKEILLVSDMQKGNGWEGLQTFQWPPDVRLKIATVLPDDPSNAAVTLLDSLPSPADQPDNSVPQKQRLRVTNVAHSKVTEFSVGWVDQAGERVSGTEPIFVNVPPGEVRVVRAPVEGPGAVGLELDGDKHDYDNRIYVAPVKPAEKQVLAFTANETDPRESLTYYLERASFDSPQQTVQYLQFPANEPLPGSITELLPSRQSLVVVAPPVHPTLLQPLVKYVSVGGTVLVVLPHPTDASSENEETTNPSLLSPAKFLTQFTAQAEDPSGPDVPQAWSIEEADIDDFALLVDIDFRHPLLTIFADPRFSDFSKIRVWAHRKVVPPSDSDWQTLIRYDDGDEALLTKSIGEGKVFVLTTGWQPEQSQLAMSTKFVPLLSRIIDSTAGEQQQQKRWSVGDARPDSNPDASKESPANRFLQPGLFTVEEGDSEVSLAVNIAPQESQTEPVSSDQLEAFGISMVDKDWTEDKQRDKERQMRDVELEENQQWWRWLVLTALGLLMVESIWAGRRIS